MPVSFDRVADIYNDTRGFPPGVEKIAAELIVRAGNLSAESRVLEVGIGTGRVAIPVAHHVAQVYGIDISTKMMGILRKNQETDNIFLVQGDGTRLPFADNSFDAVLAVHIFHLIQPRETVLQEVQRVLKPGAPLLSGRNGRNALGDLRSEIIEMLPNTSNVTWEGLDTFITEHGWSREDSLKYEYTHQMIPASLLDQLRRRSWSRTWTVSDEELAVAEEKLRATLNKRFTDLEQPVDVQGTFNVEVYLP